MRFSAADSALPATKLSPSANQTAQRMVSLRKDSCFDYSEKAANSKLHRRLGQDNL